MHLAYSALQGNNGPKNQRDNSNQPTEVQLRYHAYLETCHKYRRQIHEIQKYLPGWAPSPPNL